LHALAFAGKAFKDANDEYLNVDIVVTRLAILIFKVDFKFQVRKRVGCKNIS
jgi:hypothetical protein